MKNIKTDYLSIFEHISTIPRGSSNTKAIAEFCRDFALAYGCDAMIDNAGNVIIKCPASKGYEHKETVILQGHTDMVCEKSLDSNHDFLMDPIKLIYDNGYLRADGTTLGGDDGIAVAYALSIIADSSLKHPLLEILLTADEETGMFGAQGLDGSHFRGRMLINIDSEEEGILLCGCAGGMTAEYKANFNEIVTKARVLTVSIDKLAGGHSGADIHKKRMNAVKGLQMLLNELLAFGCRLVEFKCGSKINAIPFGGYFKVSVPDSAYEEVFKKTADFEALIKSKCISSDDKPKVECKISDLAVIKTLSDEDTARFNNFLSRIPDGIVSYTDSTKRLVQTSLNLGIVEYANGCLFGSGLLRSSKNSDIDDMADSLSEVCNSLGFKVAFSDRYPAWEYSENSILREKMCEIYEQMFNRKMKTDIIHAGLEYGIISGKIPGLDCVSIGPDMFDIHTSSERLDLASAERCYRYLLKVLEEL